jgi:hypothetical protein
MVKNSFKYNPRAHCQVYFELSKKWFGATLLTKFLLFLLGIVAIFFAKIAIYASILLFALQVLSELFSWRSDANKGIAESLLRKLDAWESFGWEISQAEISDLLARCPSSLDKLVFSQALEEEYFSSKEGIGAKRALENIMESAWWSKHLAESMRKYYLIATCALILFSISILIFSVQAIKDVDFINSLGKIVTASLMLVFSFGLLRSVLGYHNFSTKSAQIEKRIESLLASRLVVESEAIKIMNEYHIARNSAPLIPSWLWKWKRDELNKIWEGYRKIN